MKKQILLENVNEVDHRASNRFQREVMCVLFVATHLIKKVTFDGILQYTPEKKVYFVVYAGKKCLEKSSLTNIWKNTNPRTIQVDMNVICVLIHRKS